MKPINVERLLSHSTGISDSYYRATENELLEDYLKVMDFLTINEENRLSKQIKELQEKNQDNEYIIKGKLQEKEDQIKSLIGTQKIRDEAVSLLSDQVSTLIEEITFLKKQVQL
jgi:hypothetical protein